MRGSLIELLVKTSRFVHRASVRPNQMKSSPIGQIDEHVRYWPIADIAICAAHVRFRESGHDFSRKSVFKVGAHKIRINSILTTLLSRPAIWRTWRVAYATLGATVLSRATSRALSLLAALMLSSLCGVVPASAALIFQFTVTPSPAWGEDLTFDVHLFLNPDPTPAGYRFESIGFLGGTVTISPNAGVFNIIPGGSAAHFQSTVNYQFPFPFVFDPLFSVKSLSYEETYQCIGFSCAPLHKIVDVEVPDFTFHDTNNFIILRPPPVEETPLPAALSLFATGLGALGLLGWRRKKKAAALGA